jgi:hypothetical protein
MRANVDPRSVDAFLRAGIRPRWMERIIDIERGTAVHRWRLERAYAALRAACAGDREAFGARWRARARAWPFDDVNELIRQHNEWYPIERDLPMNPRTGEFVTVGGRSHRRVELTPAWVLERFPPEPRDDAS